MTPKRKQTNEEFFEEKQPVRFYKYVALTFLIITVVLFAIVVFVSAKKATITITVRPDSVEAKQTYTLGSGETTFNAKLEKTTVSLQNNYTPQSGKEEAGVAMGEVVLHNEGSLPQSLVATTRLLTAEGILFRMKTGAIVPANGTTTVQVYADKAGRDSEIGPSKFTIPGLSPEKQKIIYAVSSQTMVGGIKRVGVLGESDLQNAQNDLLSQMQKTAEEKLSALHPDLTGVFKIVSSTVSSDKKVGEEVDNFVLTGSVDVAGVFYNKGEVKDMINKELEKKVVSDSDVLSFNDSEPTVSVESYDASTSVAVVNVAGSGLVSVNPESPELAKQMFFGKDKDEIRRYLLSLNHIQSVEIKFSPAWVSTVPALADHVNVVVKSVE